MADVVWMTGLSGSGKTTLSLKLRENFGHVVVLDGDTVRSGLCSDLGFSLEDRERNIERLAHIAKIISDSGVMVIVPAITPTNRLRKVARSILGSKLMLVWVKCSLSACESRDVKGLYKKARDGEISNFTGIDSPFEDPNFWDVTCDTERFDVDYCVNDILDVLDRRARIAN